MITIIHETTMRYHNGMETYSYIYTFTSYDSSSNYPCFGVPSLAVSDPHGFLKTIREALDL